MKKVLFFSESKWAFGSIYYSLIKELYKHNIYGDLLDWNINISLTEFDLLNKNYDLFISTPRECFILYRNYNIPLNKIVCIVHEQCDLHYTNESFGIDFIDELKHFSVISNEIIQTCKELNIKIIPKITPCGISFDNYYRPILDNSLKYVSYTGAKKNLNYFGIDRKRGHLVESIVSGINGLEFANHSFYYFLCMPSFYDTIDCVVVASIQEAGGMPSMEAAASGKLVISTPVGYFKEHGKKGGGITVSLEEGKFIQETTNLLMYYRDNNYEYKIKREQIQDYARDNYDWSCVIDSWLDLFEN